jgi:hypothetical protein
MHPASKWRIERDATMTFSKVTRGWTGMINGLAGSRLRRLSQSWRGLPEEKPRMPIPAPQPSSFLTP